MSVRIKAVLVAAAILIIATIAGTSTTASAATGPCDCRAATAALDRARGTQTEAQTALDELQTLHATHALQTQRKLANKFQLRENERVESLQWMQGLQTYLPYPASMPELWPAITKARQLVVAGANAIDSLKPHYQPMIDHLNAGDVDAAYTQYSFLRVNAEQITDAALVGLREVRTVLKPVAVALDDVETAGDVLDIDAVNRQIGDIRRGLRSYKVPDLTSFADLKDEGAVLRRAMALDTNHDATLRDEVAGARDQLRAATGVVRQAEKDLRSCQKQHCPVPDGPTCEFSYGQVTDCASTNPTAGVSIVNRTNTSACTFSITLDWGDGARETYDYRGGPAGNVHLTDHTYTAAREYAIKVTGRGVSGFCSFSGTTFAFELVAP